MRKASEEECTRLNDQAYANQHILDTLQEHRGTWFHIAWDEIRPKGSHDEKFAALMDEARRYDRLFAFIESPAESDAGLFGLMA